MKETAKNHIKTSKKIKLYDNNEIRQKIDEIYACQNQIVLAKWSLEVAKHVLQITNFDISKYPAIQEGFHKNELWQMGKARMHDVRQSSFMIHKIAREHKEESSKTILRVIGHAIASGHMKEHSMVASDYAIKVINVLYEKNYEKVTEERTWQLEKILELSKN